MYYESSQSYNAQNAYLTSGKKVKDDGRHLLLLIQMEEEESKYWKIISRPVGPFALFNGNRQLFIQAGPHFL